MNIEKILTGQKVTSVKSQDYSLSITLILEDGTRFTIFADYYGQDDRSPILNYKTMKITRNDTNLRSNK